MLFRSSALFGGVALVLAAMAPLGGAAAFTLGSSNEAVIEPPVPHPDETPCVVPLVSQAVFGANAVAFDYTPPAACPGPWATVVLSVDIALNAGVQFDRTGELFLAGVPLWFGTTAEPREKLAPSWNVQRDVTDYSALYRTGQTGSLLIANFTSAVDTSVITASASLSFYPATSTAPAPVTADLVIPLPAGGGIATLNTGTDTLATTLTLPTNILDATLDLYLQSQQDDEFWYTCVPTALANELQSCSNGALREGEISVDGVPAGVAPIYPWIFTGGIDPALWEPIPGVQTLSFKPAHADLSPFAGVLSNGQPHTVAASVFGANQHFSATGALRLFLDPKAANVTGGIVTNTLAGTPTVNLVQNLTNQNGVISGTVDTGDSRDFTISGTVTGSAGELVKTLTQRSTFQNNQSFLINSTLFTQNIQQVTDIYTTETTTGGGVTSVADTELHYPLTVLITLAGPNAAGGFAQTTSIDQKFVESDFAFGSQPGKSPVFSAQESNEINTTDTLLFDQNFNITGNQDQSSVATFQTDNPCFRRVLTAEASVLTGVKTGGLNCCLGE
ncbi:MAG: peptide-N4-asparagine amidase [Aliidongia sp.]